MRRVILTLAAAAALGACSHDPKPGYIADRFRASMAEMAISPIYPPREDFYPGDVYVSTTNGTDHLQTAIRADSVAVPLGVPTIYAQRPAFAALEDMIYKQLSDQSKVWQQPLTPIFADGAEAVRPRLVVFPLYDFATSTSGSLGANMVSSSAGGLLGVAGGTEAQVSMGIPAGVHMAVNAVDAHAALAARCAATPGYPEMMGVIGRSLASKNGDKDKVIQLVNEVYYTYAIDYEFGSSQSFGAEVEASVDALNKLNDKRQGILTSLAQLRGGQPAAPAGKESEERDLLAQLKTTEEEMAAKTRQLAPTLPGVAATFRSGNKYSIQLRQTFQRPVAIGYRRTAYKMPDKNCALQGFHADATTAPGEMAPALVR